MTSKTNGAGGDLDPVALTQRLVRCPSVTPADAGALSVLEEFLGATGFECHRAAASTGVDRQT